MTDLARIAREQREIEAYEQGPPTDDPAWLGAMWRADYAAEMRLLCREARSHDD